MLFLPPLQKTINKPHQTVLFPLPYFEIYKKQSSFCIEFFVILLVSLQGAGCIESGANPIPIAMEHRPEEIYPEIGRDKDHSIDSYLLVTFEKKNKKQ
jgi:hypothetical protein